MESFFVLHRGTFYKEAQLSPGIPSRIQGCGICLMSSIAKVFIIINFVLSVLFLGFAATLLSQQWDYRQVYLETKYQYAQEKQNWESSENEVQGYVENLRSLLNQRTSLLKETQAKIADYETQNNELRAWKDNVSQSLKAIDNRIDTLDTRIEEKDRRIAELTREKQDKASDLRRAEEEARTAKDEQETIQLELDRYRGRLAETEKMLQRSRRELWEAKQVIRSVQSVGVNIQAIMQKAPPLEGQIVAVSPKVPLVMLSIGSDEGVQQGYQFTVYRGSRYIGQVVVEEVYSDMCAARIVRDMTRHALQRGDRVTTRIGGGSF